MMEASMATTLKFLPGSTIRWRATRFIVVDYADIDAIIAREVGKRKLERIPVRDAKPDRTGSGANIIKCMFLSGEKASQILGGQDHGPNFRCGGCFSG